MNVFDTLWPILAIGAIIYFLILRPQQQEQARHEALLTSLAKDDKVVTASGIHGKVVDVGTDTVVLQVADKARVTFDKKAIIRREGETLPQQ